MTRVLNDDQFLPRKLNRRRLAGIFQQQFPAIVLAFSGMLNGLAQESSAPLPERSVDNSAAQTPDAEEPTQPQRSRFADINELISRMRLGFEQAMEIADTERDESLQELSANYNKQLNILQRGFTESGNSLGALSVRDEIERIEKGKELLDDQVEGVGLARVRELRRMYTGAKGEIDERWEAEAKRLVGLGKNALDAHSRELTRKGDLDRVAALEDMSVGWTGRPELEKLGDRSASSGRQGFPATVHFFFKGDVELFHNGEKIFFEGESVQFGQSGVSNTINVAAGHVIVFRLRSDAKYRSLIATVVSEREKKFVPFKLRDYRYLENIPGVDVTAADVRNTNRRPDSGIVHEELEDVWESHKLTKQVKKESDWITIPQEGVWTTYAVEIEPGDIEMMR